MLYYLALYFHPQVPVNPGVYIDFFEVLNEPNLMFWPQYESTAGNPLMHLWAAAMMATARHVTRSTGNLPMVMGPAIANTNMNTSATVDWRTFMTRTLDTLAAWGIASDQYMAWSLHNYGDIRYDDNRAREARLLLESRGWRGWPYQDPARVYVMATEGGDVISGSSDYQRQAQRVGDNWNRMRGTAGVGMVNNYQTWSNAGYDTGLCVRFPSPPPDGSRPRSDYHRPVLNTWADLPTSAPR
jgi:hypothetical protein